VPDPAEDRLCALANAAIYGLDQYTTNPAETVGALAWALGRLCHKLNLSREFMHTMVDKAYAFSIASDKQALTPNKQGRN
jgi:hypothetical protein